ncbi:Ig-like domain-containing protein, partial [Mycolicibacterium sp. XJ1819]
ANGTLELNADGSFTYTPNQDFYGTDTFTYMANDGELDGNTATVTITVNPVNDEAPVTIDDAYQVDEDGVLTVPAAGGVLANDTDFDDDDLTAILVDGPANGTLELNADG